MSLSQEYRSLLASIAEGEGELEAARKALLSLAGGAGAARAPRDAGAPTCPGCRRPLPAQVRFCRFCGSPVDGGQQARTAAWGLVVPGRDAVVPLGEGLLIGRAAGCDLRLDDGKVSRQHARVERRGQGVWIADLGSSNGVFVNGRRVGQPLRLAPGDRILIGDTSLEVVERGS